MPTQIHKGQLSGTRWDARQYLKFSDQRLRPALELLDRVFLASPTLIYDLGCGAGNVTRLIAERWPAASVHGLDNSREMLEKARLEAGKVQWIEADIHEWQPDSPADLIYANASLQWLDDHRMLFPRLAGLLKPGGCLAVQMPLSWSAPSHRIMRETLTNGGPGGSAIGNERLRDTLARDWVEEAQVYYDLLAGCSDHIDIWETEYLQILEGGDPVLEWVKGSGLRPILNSLSDEDREYFLAEYARRLRDAYPRRADGRTCYPFRRLFIVATVA